MLNNAINIAFLIIITIPILLFILTLVRIVGEDMKASIKHKPSSPFGTHQAKKQVKKQKTVHRLRKVK
ncbi:hypothetical protein CACET_c00670 [Clostridium aceticum]|uniref:Uncharacterized protein n=1 Tax=Clostridium aceticum TaxID=84022 RepID=A0A0D8IDA5_9CLOT|nr:hypothetical protein [Clostridium aceticum]AKL93585.1 hypothetical protein CACET_c00670 [Clostridium aceticum]KJF27176.1 hypothetical protein TZ02_08870 [Clostridium aceticum]